MDTPLKNSSHSLSIRDYILGLIDQKQLNPQSKLPPERMLCERFSITRITLRQALGQLETEGLIYRLHHKGWFVSPPRILYDPTKNLSFTEFVLKQNRSPQNKILSIETHHAKPWMREAFHLNAQQDEVYALRRLRSVDGRAVMVENLYINAAYCPGVLDCPIEKSVTNVLRDNYNIIITRSSIRMHTTALTAEQANDLNVASGTPALHVYRTNYDQHGNIIMVDLEFWRHDALEITVSSEVVSSVAVTAENPLAKGAGDQQVTRSNNGQDPKTKALENFYHQTLEQMEVLKARLEQLQSQ